MLISTWWQSHRLLEVDGSTKLELAKKLFLIARTKFNEYLKGEKLYIGEKYDIVKVRQPDTFRRKLINNTIKRTYPLAAPFDVRTQTGYHVGTQNRMSSFLLT